MAVSKIWPLYQTIGKAVKYICNYEKTEDGTLIAAYKCAERFADHEFEDIARKARKIMKPRIGYHMTISFSPEDIISPQKALELGREIIDKYTDGKYQYVMSVHTDQEHLHVHCILNSVSFQDYKKLHIKDKELQKLERITDEACKGNGLSVIEKKSGVRGRGKFEYKKHVNNDSWKDKLRECIDRTIVLSESYDDFIRRMEMEEGYEVKLGKYLSFRAEGQERFTRTRRLGDFYSIESIKERIENKGKYQSSEKNADKDEGSYEAMHRINESQKSVVLEKNNVSVNKISFDNGVKKIIDVQGNEKAQKNSAYRRKLNMINIDTYAGMMNFVSRYHLVYAEDFEKIKTELEEKNQKLTTDIRKAYSELNILEADVKQFQKYFESRKAHAEYITTHDKDKKFELSSFNKQYESALIYFKRNDISLSNVTIQNLQQKIDRIELIRSAIEKLKEERSNVHNDIRKLKVIYQNNVKIFGDELPENSGLEKKNKEERDSVR